MSSFSRGTETGKAANNFGSLHLSKDGAKPQQEHRPRYCVADVTSKGGAKLQIIWEFIFEQGRGEAPTGI